MRTIRLCVPADHTALGVLRMTAQTRTVIAAAKRTYDPRGQTVIKWLTNGYPQD